jgi:hypothetical protein
MPFVPPLALEADGGPLHDPLAKAWFFAELARIVEEGGAVTAILESGVGELRLLTGEIFHFGEEAITRIA